MGFTSKMCVLGKQVRADQSGETRWEIDDGRIVADGTHAHLLATEPRYRAIVAQVEDREVGA